MNENIVYFPAGESTDPISLEAAAERLDVIREVFVEAAAEAVTMCGVQAAQSAGYPIDEYAHAREIALVRTAIKSLMMASRGMPHQLQDVAKEMFELVGVDELYAEEASE